MTYGGDVRAALQHERHFLTTAEAAEYLRLKRRTLEDMRVTGNGPRYFKMGPGRMARVVYRKIDLDGWVEKFSYASTSEY